MGEGLLALKGSCLSHSCPAGVFLCSVEGEDSLSPPHSRVMVNSFKLPFHQYLVPFSSPESKG